MADAPKLVGTDTLAAAFPKINAAIDNANEAKHVQDGVQAQIDALVVNGDSSPEAAQARVDASGKTYSTLQARLNDADAQLADMVQQKADKTEINSLATAKADKTYVDSNITTLDAKINSQASGAPKGTYATLNDLQTAFPIGNTNIYVVTSDKNWYYWNDNAWTIGGQYLNDPTYKRISLTWNGGKYIKSDGTLVTNPDYSYTNMFKIIKGQTIYINAVVYTSQSLLSKWNADGTFKANITIGNGSVGYSYTATEDVEYLKISNAHVVLSLSEAYVQITNEESEALLPIYDKVKKIGNIALTWVNGKYIKPDGTITSYTPYAYTNSFKLLKGQKITIKAGAYSSASLLSKWTPNGKFIKSIAVGDGTAGYEYTANDDIEYLRISTVNTVVPYQEAYVQAVSEPIAAIESLYSSEDFILQNISQMALDMADSLPRNPVIVSSSTTEFLGFTAMIWFNNQLLVFYRRAVSHTSFEGQLCYKTSTDGITWSNETVLLSETGVDFRDPNVIVFNGNLVLKYVRRTTDTDFKVYNMHTTDLGTWSTGVLLPAMDGNGYSSRGTMVVNGGVLYAVLYTLANETYLVKTSDLVTWSFVTKVASNTNEASITYYDGKYVVVSRNGASSNQYRPMIWSESTDLLTWTHKKMAIMSDCPSITLHTPTGYGQYLLVNYRDKSQKYAKAHNHGYFNVAGFNTQGVLVTKIYNVLKDNNLEDIGYGEVVIQGGYVYISYYRNSDTLARIYVNRYNLTDFNNYITRV